MYVDIFSFQHTEWYSVGNCDKESENKLDRICH